MSRKVWTTQGKLIIAIIGILIIVFLSLGGCEAISRIIKENDIGELVGPNNEK